MTNQTSFPLGVLNFAQKRGTFMVSLSTTVGELQQKMVHHGVPLSQQRLLFGSTWLDNPDSTLASVGVTKNSTATVKMMPPEGSLLYVPHWPLAPGPRSVVLLKYIGSAELVVMPITKTQVGPHHAMFPYYFRIVLEQPDVMGPKDIFSAVRLIADPSFLQGHILCTIPFASCSLLDVQVNADTPAFDAQEIIQNVVKGVLFP